MATTTLKGPFSGECLNGKTVGGNHLGRRRVFVQTETGYVLGIELDGSDSAHTIKRRLQLALNVPTEETLLICGDTVLKNDLSTVRNLSPLLLTRTCLHRSSSTPCLSPSAEDVQLDDQSGPIEIIGCSSHFPGTKHLVKDIVKAMKNGNDPIPVHGGLGGAYYFRGCNGENVAIVKPTDEEPFAPNNPKGFVGKALGQPGLKQSIRVGETGFREVAAYLLDYDGFANVPSTALVKVSHPIFNVNIDGASRNNHHQQREAISKIASFQQFIPHDCDASDYGTSSFPVSAVHRIGILDIRILNTDRHAGNLLVRKLEGVGRFGQVDLVPIDHGLCLPESLEDPYFEWIHWPQASFPFSKDELEYIANLDPFHDSEMLRLELPMVREACLRVLVICTIFLKEAAGYGLCLAEIGEMMSREFQGCEEKPSELELICIEARSLSEMVQFDEMDGEDEFQFDLEYDSYEWDLTRKSDDKLNFDEKRHDKINGWNSTNVLFKLEEGAEDSKMLMPLPYKTGIPGDESWKHQGLTLKGGYFYGVSSGNRSVNEQLPASSCFVTLADMNEEEWSVFLENFRKLLYPAFMNHKAVTMSKRPRQRLGTSCKF